MHARHVPGSAVDTPFHSRASGQSAKFADGAFSRALRASHSDDALTRGLGLRLFDFKMHAWHIEREDVVGALRTLRSETRTGPTLLHCTLGADRTGLVAALYRMIYQGWSKEDALEEMEHGGFGFHDIWINIPRFIHELDMGELKRDVALP